MRNQTALPEPHCETTLPASRRPGRRARLRSLNRRARTVATGNRKTRTMSVETVNFTTVKPENWALEPRCQNHEARTPEQDCSQTAKPDCEARITATEELCGRGCRHARTVAAGNRKLEP